MPDRNDGNIVKRTSQYIDNLSFDESLELPLAAIAGTPDGENVYRAQVDDSGALSVASGLIPVKFTRIQFSNPNGNTPPNYQTGTVKNGSTTVGSLSLSYDGYGTLTDVEFTAV